MMRFECAAALLLTVALQIQATAQDKAQKDLRDIGTFAKWAKVEIPLRGPVSKGTGEPNPFDVFVNVLFTGPSGKTYRIPAFYHGDGEGGLDGNQWAVRFSADETGRWWFRSRSQDKTLDGVTGSFTVTAVPEDAADFYRWGRLEAVGTAENEIRYLKFREGPFWMKAGCDDPENFLGAYPGYDTLEERKAAVDYLAERGINSFYIMSHNLDGDDNDVWPWLGETPEQAKRNGAASARFDFRVLEDWRMLFEHMQQRGMVVYLILEDDSAWKDYDHARYYREMIARFGYLPGLLFNLGEEHNENYDLPEALEWMRQLAELDPYDHPRGIHNVNTPRKEYIDAEYIDFTSIQTGTPGTRRGLKNAVEHNELAIDWIRQCKARDKRFLMINFDEGRPEQERAAWWAAYLGGAVWEAHVLEPYNRPMSAWEKTWNELGGARSFMETLPFWEMQPHNEVVESGHAVCLAKPGHAYALYLPQGGTVSVALPAGSEYALEWWDPANGRQGSFQNAGQIHGGTRELVAPGPGDWAVRILATSEKKD